MRFFLSFPRRVVSAIAGLEEAKNLAGKVLRLIQIRLATLSVEKISDICKVNCRAKTRTRQSFVGGAV